MISGFRSILCVCVSRLVACDRNYDRRQRKTHLCRRLLNFRVSVFSKIAVKTRSLVHTINYGVIKVKRVPIYHLDFCAMSCPGPDIQSFYT